MIESLESRTCCAGVTTTLASGVLTIVGSDRAETIAVAAGREQIGVEADGGTVFFKAREIKLIRVYSGSGNDTIILSPRLAIRASIEGGGGNDRIGGGARNDTIFGQAGDDTIVGNPGDDYIDGGKGDDYLEDTLGNNVIHGGAGNDESLSEGWQLGSGVETSRELPEGGPDFITNGATDIRNENGRIVLAYSGFSPSLSDTYGQSGPTRLANGQFEVSTTIHFAGFGSIVGDFEQRWDITNEINAGIIFSRTDADSGGPLTQAFSVQLLLPSSRT